MPVHTPGKHQLPEPGGQQTEGSAGARGWDALPSSLASFGKVAYSVPLCRSQSITVNGRSQR